MWTARGKQGKKRVAFIECDMCYKVEPVPLVGRKVTARAIRMAGWYIKGLAVVCPQCRQQLQEN